MGLRMIGARVASTIILPTPGGLHPRISPNCIVGDQDHHTALGALGRLPELERGSELRES